MAPPPEIVEVRCAGCGETLEVEPGLTEFACPDCGTQQALPPELMPQPPARPRRAVPIPGRGAGASASARLPCGGCGAMLSVPHGLGRFACPLCGIELAVDGARLRLYLASASAAATVRVVAPPVTSPFPSRRPEVQEEPTSQAIRAGQGQAERYNKPIHSEQTQGQYPNLFRADTRTATYVGRGQKGPLNPSVNRDESYIEPLIDTMARPSNKKTRFPVGPESVVVEKVRSKPPSQVSHAQQVHGGPPNYLAQTDQAQGQRFRETVASHGEKETGRAVVSSIVDKELIEPLNQTVHPKQVQVESQNKTSGWKQKRKRSSKTTGQNHKRKNKGLMSSNEELELRRSKRFSKVPDRLIDMGKQLPAASPDRSVSDPPDIDIIIANLCPSPLPQHQMPQANSSESGNVDATIRPASSNHGTSQAEQFPHCYSQLYPPEVSGTLAKWCFNSVREHEMPQERSNGTRGPDKSGSHVQPNEWQAVYQVIYGQQAQESSSAATNSEQVRGEPHSKGIDKNKMKGLMSSSNEGRVATSSLLLSATPLPTTTSPSVLTEPPVHSSPHRQPTHALHSKGDGLLSESVGRPLEKGRGRRPTRLIEPRREVDRPVLIPNNVDTWDVHPLCTKVASTITVLLKQRHPGSTYLLVSQLESEPSSAQEIHHWHQYPPDARDTILDEFLLRYKWAPGKEAECRKLFDRRAVKQFIGLLCEEKRRAREELAAVQKTKEQSEFGEEDTREELEDQQAEARHKNEDPLQWKPFPPAWMQPKWWEMLCEHWAKEEVLQMSAKYRKNRYKGGHALHTTGSRSIAMTRQLMVMENGGKPVSDIDVFIKTHKHGGGKGEFVTEKARRTAEAFKRRMEEAGDTLLDPHLVWAEEVGGRNRGRYYGLPGIIDKARIDALAKSNPSYSGKLAPRQKFTQEQVQQMINQALQGLNETWEKKFQFLEQNMRAIPLLGIASEHAPQSSGAGVRAQENQAPHQDTSGSDSVHGEEYGSARDEDEDHSG